MDYNEKRPIERGEIYYISNAKYYNTGPNNTTGRPGVVVSSDELNKWSNFVEVVYLTSQEKKPMPTHVEVVCKAPSTALCETIYTVNKDRLGDFICRCTDEEIRAINDGLLHSLGITPPVIEVEKEGVDNSIEVERNLYKTLYENLLSKVIERGDK